MLCLYGHLCHGTCVETEGKPCGVGFPLPRLCDFQGLNPGSPVLGVTSALPTAPYLRSCAEFLTPVLWLPVSYFSVLWTCGEDAEGKKGAERAAHNLCFKMMTKLGAVFGCYPTQACSCRLSALLHTAQDQPGGGLQPSCVQRGAE